nr:FAD-dependent thymidylate synthase [Pseudoramibacter sp. HA2172]
MESILKVSLLTHTPDPEKAIAAAAKLCYSSSGIPELMANQTPDKVQGFLNRLSNYGHLSPVEHVSFTFGIEGVSRSLTHQLVRHRLASYSQKSQRYVTEGQFDYIMPPEIAAIPAAKARYLTAMADDQAAYDELTDTLKAAHLKTFLAEGLSEDEAARRAEKKAIEDARYVLPNGCETKIVMTMNARELLHFFNHRCCNRAQWEIRECATQMLLLVKKVAPTLFKNAGPSCLNGPCPEGNMYCGDIQGVRARFTALHKANP